MTIEEDGRDVDNAVGFILTSLFSIFPGVPTEYVLFSLYLSGYRFFLRSSDDVGWQQEGHPVSRKLGVGLLVMELCTSYSSSCRHHPHHLQLH